MWWLIVTNLGKKLSFQFSSLSWLCKFSCSEKNDQLLSLFCWCELTTNLTLHDLWFYHPELSGGVSNFLNFKNKTISHEKLDFHPWHWRHPFKMFFPSVRKTVLCDAFLLKSEISCRNCFHWCARTHSSHHHFSWKWWMHTWVCKVKVCVCFWKDTVLQFQNLANRVQHLVSISLVLLKCEVKGLHPAVSQQQHIDLQSPFHTPHLLPHERESCSWVWRSLNLHMQSAAVSTSSWMLFSPSCQSSFIVLHDCKLVLFAPHFLCGEPVMLFQWIFCLKTLDDWQKIACVTCFLVPDDFHHDFSRILAVPIEKCANETHWEDWHSFCENCIQIRTAPVPGRQMCEEKLSPENLISHNFKHFATVKVICIVLHAIAGNKDFFVWLLRQAQPVADSRVMPRLLCPESSSLLMRLMSLFNTWKIHELMLNHALLCNWFHCMLSKRSCNTKSVCVNFQSIQSNPIYNQQFFGFQSTLSCCKQQKKQVNGPGFSLLDWQLLAKILSFLFSPVIHSRLPVGFALDSSILMPWKSWKHRWTQLGCDELSQNLGCPIEKICDAMLTC